jgi:hypothetical protein
MSNLPNQAVANSPPPKPIETVRAALEKMRSQFQTVLPKHITAERLYSVAMTAIQQTPKLLEGDRQSLYSAVMRSAHSYQRQKVLRGLILALGFDRKLPRCSITHAGTVSLQ